MDIHAPNPHELDSYPHVFFTSDTLWVPTNLDQETNLADLADPDQPPLDPSYYPNTLNDYGDITCSTTSIISPPMSLSHYLHTLPKYYHQQAHITTLGKPDYIKLRPNFGFAPIYRIKHTLSNTTQYARMDT